jgi:hypothetical protein
LFERLIKEGKLKPQEADIDYLNALLDAARRNFETALVLRGKIDEAAFKLFYDGLLQISRVVVLPRKVEEKVMAILDERLRGVVLEFKAKYL